MKVWCFILSLAARLATALPARLGVSSTLPSIFYSESSISSIFDEPKLLKRSRVNSNPRPIS